jgi:hypothetical protein
MFVPFDSIFTVLPGTFGRKNYIWGGQVERRLRLKVMREMGD